MKNLLKLEFTKLKRQKSFYVCTLLAVAILALMTCTTHAATKHLGAEQLLGMSGIGSMLDGCSQSLYVTLAGVFAALFFCEDTTQQTLKNIIAKGYTKQQIFWAKAISACAAATVMFLVVELSALALGTAFYGLGDVGNYEFLSVLAIQYVANMGWVLMCILMCAMFRKIGGSIAAILLLPDVIAMVLALVDSLQNTVRVTLTDFWFYGILNDALTISTISDRILDCLWASLIYIPIFLVIGRSLYKKQEV